MSPFLKHYFRWIYFLPLIHFCVCLAYIISEAVGRGLDWGPLIMADLPFSIIGAGLLWRGSGLGALFFVIIGTVWWYVVSLIIALLFRRIMLYRASFGSH